GPCPGSGAVAALAAGVLVWLGALAMPRPTFASPIQGETLTVATEAALGPAWERFLAGGPALWAVEPPPSFPSGLLLPTANGVVTETPFVDYLIGRRSLDPARVDQNHPNIAPMLDARDPPAATPAPSPGATRPLRVPGPNPHPQQGPAVPEPGTLLIGLGMGVPVLCRHRRARLARRTHS